MTPMEMMPVSIAYLFVAGAFVMGFSLGMLCKR